MPETTNTDIRSRAHWVEYTLTGYYGPRPYRDGTYDSDLTGALVATILSQHTSDINSGRAYLSLLKEFGGNWSDVMNAPLERIATSIRSGGLADVKADRIRNLLHEIWERTGALTLDHLREMDDASGMQYLQGFHGVGPKTAACVLMFNLGRSVIPVDTHVHRVAIRLGLVPEKMSAGESQDRLLDLVGASHAYSFHVHLIEHGRIICHAQRPKCSQCPINVQCDFYHEHHAQTAIGR